MTKQYWPMAKVREKDGTIRTQATYDPYGGYNGLRDALNAITVWSDTYHFDIVEAWIDMKMKNPEYSERIEVKHCWVAYTDDFTCIGDSIKKEETNGL